MSIYAVLALVAAVYAAAWAALIKAGDKKRRPSAGLRLRDINTNTKKGRRQYLDRCAKLAAQAREELKDGIE